MKRLASFILGALGYALVASAQDSPPAAVNPTVLAVPESAATATRCLFIGNSYTYYNDLPQMIADLARAGGQQTFQFEMETPGGRTLEKHWKDGKAGGKIAAGHWQFVVLQEQSLRPLKDPQLMFDYATKLQGEISKQQARTILYQSWARKGRIADQAEINRAFQMLGRELKVDVAPVGTAWALALKENPKWALHAEDGSHPTKTGTYLAACVFYSTLYGKSPEGLPGKPGDVSDTEAKRLQAIAWEAVRQLTE
jgi:hypothetical protein